MKRIAILILCLIVSLIVAGQDQEKKKTSNEIKEVVVTQPRFIGFEEMRLGLNQDEFASLNDYLMKHIEYPIDDKKFYVEGTEVVQFAITPSGKVTDIEFINSLSPSIDQEVARVLESTNNMWKPGLENGIPTKRGREISIVFNLSNNDTKFDYASEVIKQAKLCFDKGNKKLYVKKNIKSAVRFYDMAMRYLPNDKCLLGMRGICRYELGDKDGACHDWNRIKSLGGVEADSFLTDLCEYKGYAEMINVIQEKE